jgi:hypothetical protein
MSHLSILADALLFLGKSIDPQSVTKVIFGFEHSPSDIGLDVWKFKATLQGSKGDEDPGGAQLSFSQSWEGMGHTDEEAIRATFKPVQAHIEGFLRLRENETGFAQQALLVLTGSGVLQGIWATEDPASPVETGPGDASLQEMQEAAEPLNGQVSSV